MAGELQTKFESAIAAGDHVLVHELVSAGADIEQPCRGALLAWQDSVDEPQGLTIGGALVQRYIDGADPQNTVLSLQAAFKHSAGGGLRSHLPRAWVEGKLPLGETSNTVLDQVILLSRPLPEKPRKSVFNLYGPSSATIVLGGLDFSLEALRTETENVLINQMRYDDALSSHLRGSHFSVQMAMRYVDAIGTFPPNLLSAMEALPFSHDGEDCPLLHFLVEQAAVKKTAGLARVGAIRAIEAGSDPNIESSAGRTPLMQAAFHGLHEIMGALLEAGADIHKRDRRKWTAKTYAKTSNVKASANDKHAASVLLEAWRAKQAIRGAVRKMAPAR